MLNTVKQIQDVAELRVSISFPFSRCWESGRTLVKYSGPVKSGSWSKCYSSINRLFFYWTYDNLYYKVTGSDLIVLYNCGHHVALGFPFSCHPLFYWSQFSSTDTHIVSIIGFSVKTTQRRLVRCCPTPTTLNWGKRHFAACAKNQNCEGTSLLWEKCSSAPTRGSNPTSTLLFVKP